MMRLAEVAGQERAVSLLSSAILAGTYPNAWLFAGPAGVGKASAALAVAAACNCLAGGESGGGLFGGPVTAAKPVSDACGVCASCRKIAAGNHPDVRVLKLPPEKKVIPIELVRDALNELSFKPYEGKRRFVIVDGAESLTPQAGNALLKSLEEPPAHSTWILVSVSPSRLLPTVVSRCRILRFGALPVAVAAGILVQRAQMESGEARAIAALLGGSVGRALGPEAEFFTREMRATVVDEALDAISAGAKILDVADLWDKRNKDEAMPLGIALEQLSLWLRDIAVWQADGEGARLLHSDLSDRTASTGRRASPEAVARAFDGTRRCVLDLQGNVNAKLALETLFLTLRRELA